MPSFNGKGCFKLVVLSNFRTLLPDLSAFVRLETRRTIQRNSFEIPAGVKTDPILNNYLTQTMENNARSGVRCPQAEMSFVFIFSTIIRIEKTCVVF